MSKHIDKGRGQTHYDGDDCSPEPQFNGLDLSELTKKIANEHTVQFDGGLAQYVKSAIELLKAQGKDITDYTLVNVNNPLEMKDTGAVISSSWRIVKIEDTQVRPTYND